VTEVSLREELLAAYEKRGKLIVTVPDGARLYLNNSIVATPAKEQLFDTPVLADGDVHRFTVSVKQDRDGKTYAETREIDLKAGEVIRLSLPAPTRFSQVPGSQPATLSSLK